jgi:hypothetical protein
MFKYQIHALAMRKLGLGRPFRLLFLLIILGCLAAGLIYSVVVFHAVAKRSQSHHVQHPPTN